MTGMTGKTWMAGTPRDDWDGCHDSDVVMTGMTRYDWHDSDVKDD